MMTTMLTGLLLSAAVLPQTDTVVSVRPGTHLDIDNFGGSVIVRTWDRQGQMRIAADHSSRTWVEIQESARSVRLRARSRGAASVDYEISVPADVHVDIRGTHTDAEVYGVGGDIAVYTVHGRITVEGGRGVVTLTSVQGDVAVAGADGRVSVETTNGSVRVTDSRGSIFVEAVNGSVILDDIVSADVDVSTMNGDVEYDGLVADDGRYRFSTHSGSVILAVPETVNATVSVSTFSGSFEAGFPITLSGTRERGRRFDFTIGDGGARVELESFSGSIEIRRGGGSVRR